ncbi:PHA/PHB synthase family protein [Roseateles oligotrophus]|uniref:Alpha/beta fold hydrolase n=1 Tax=Roseateles oligotrophus TaxID=1769250 RepID=A0ABT2YGM1_9BURK|nr:alpha/beta fold hydrolase [Roseateles oligotrophus]MCV2369136.1 alpha/beta fold hydrolase [Roseateles oligotrophus]
MQRLNSPFDPSPPARNVELPTQRLDRLLHASAAPLTAGISPVALSLALADWAWHLAVSPGRQLELARLGAQLATQTLKDSVPRADDSTSAKIGEQDSDPRFRHQAWAQWPFTALRSGFRQSEEFWREAARMPGMSAHHAEMTQFFARQALNMLAPANWLPTNPVVLQDAVASRGAHLLQGARHWLEDVSGGLIPTQPTETNRHVPGRDVAITPGQVVMRNHLVELIRYSPQTEQVYPEPLLIVPSWIMKYYILDLSPHNSMVRYLVEQGHQVYMLSWRNPDASDHDLSMNDYLRLGIFEALRAIGDIHGKKQPVHAMGYCLGGTLLSIAAAALGRRDGQAGEARGDRGGVAGAENLPELRSLTLLAAQTDFSEPGELGLFIDESQIGYVDEITRGKGYLSGEQMAGSFQFLHSRDLVWTRRMREYLMGEREPHTDLMDWNADTTRMPARMHHEYLTALYLHNALATSSYRVDGRSVSLGDIELPIFLVGTERDHVSPWQSVYKLHHLCEAEITFVLTSGGHNAGIISEPGHPGRSFRIDTRPRHGAWVPQQEWPQGLEAQSGSWWPAWHDWLAARSTGIGKINKARARPESMKLGDAPGLYVRQCYPD